MNTYAVIMAGGIGERLWPLSRQKRPKQVLKLCSERTMIEETIERVKPMVPMERIIVVTGNDMKEAIQGVMPELTDGNFITEPCRRNTAPAIFAAASHILAKDSDGIMVVLSSDHFIKPYERFAERIATARSVAESTDALVLIGIEPSRPETGYGYIEIGKPLKEFEKQKVFSVDSFKEKPNHLTADRYYTSGKHLWNSGMFVWKASTIMDEAKKYLPEMYASFQKYTASIGQDNETNVLEMIYNTIVSKSIDHGILEHSKRVVVLWASFIWDDVGSPLAIPRIHPPDEDGNTTIGKAVFYNSYQNIVVNQREHPVVLFGLSDLVIIHTDDVLLITTTSRESEMRRLMELIKENNELKEYL